MPFADHPHDLDPLDGGVSGRQRFESAHGIDDALQRAMVGFKPVVEIFYLPMFERVGHLAQFLKPLDRLAIGFVLVGVNHRRRTILAILEGLAEEPLS